MFSLVKTAKTQNFVFIKMWFTSFDWIFKDISLFFT